MAGFAEPAAKRRKLQVETRHRYITIAQASKDVNVAQLRDPEIEEGLDTNSIPVLLKDTRLDDGILRGYFSPAVRKSLPNLFFSEVTSPKNPAGEILKHCDGLESIHRCKEDRPPLVCSEITLTPYADLVRGRKLFHLEVKILWQDTASPRNKVSSQHLAILSRYLRSESINENLVETPEKWDPRDFYDNVHVPEETLESSADIANDLMSCHLYPFQRRAVWWLLDREGVQLRPDGRIQPRQHDKTTAPRSFLRAQDATGSEIYVSQLLGCVSSNLSDLQDAFPNVSGGILAEEMGLGKTVELIALMCSNRGHDSNQDTNYERDSDNRIPQKLIKSRATLIITPPSILEQWKQELEQHAPGLKVVHYNGLKAVKRRVHDESLAELANNDVVLTTYNVLSREIHYAREKPDRQLRDRSRHEPPKSPLTQICWWRVCLDEAQMVESGVSQAAQVARLIPRVHAWAVSGTPLRGGHKDLYGLFLFLRCEPLCHSVPTWNRLLDYHRPLFKQLLGTLAIRHSKNLVREDLRLPPQTRHTITVPFTAIEEQHYDQLCQEMCEDIGLDRFGGPLNDGWDPNSPYTIEKMRTWLNRLRQTCLHPEVGGRNRRALGRTGGPLRSVMQVLEVMIDQNEGTIRAEQRLLYLSQIHRGQMLERSEDTEGAIELWKAAYNEIKETIAECRESVAKEREVAKVKDRSISVSPEDSKEEEDPDSRLATCRQRLRAALEVQHIAVFFLGNGYFQMKSKEGVQPDSEEFHNWERREVAAFEEAKQIRVELLSDILKKVGFLMDLVRQKVNDASTAMIPRMHVDDQHGGIESRKMLEKLHYFCEAMNDQAEQYIRWRDQMANFLQESLMDTEDSNIELSGEEYDASAKNQDEMYVYMDALRAMFSDRNDALTGQSNFLIAQEMKVALQAAKRNEGPAPQLFLEILALREKFRIPKELGSLRGIISEIRQVVTALEMQVASGRDRAKVELSLVSGVLKAAQAMSSAQQKAVAGGLEREVDLFRDTMNTRLEYYRGLQKISDTVAAYEPVDHKPGEPVPRAEFLRCIESEQQKGAKISTLLAKRRYLAHLKVEQSASGVQRNCVICQSTFEQGTLTVCGHVYCRDCILLWWNRHRSCPTCKRYLRSTDFHDITYKPQDLVVQKEAELDRGSPTRSVSNDSSKSEQRSAANGIYSDISATTLNQIKNIDLREASGFGTKVDTMCRHLLWLRDHDPGCKAIFFSQYREFLDVLGAAMTKNQITFSRVDGKSGIENFKKDPNIECFLLHAKAHSAGLNLINANHVFLCEPLINTALELQAIARVHRIGQQRETTVWMYLVADTVEKSIYDISVTRRLAHLRREVSGSATSSRSGTVTPRESGDTEGAIDAANSLALQSVNLNQLLTSGKSGGEFVGSDDLWQCLFGKADRRGQGLSAALGEADSQVGRFLRAEAAEERRREGQQQ
jgi:E3 ubiquitin-protein ligase SHPRH